MKHSGKDLKKYGKYSVIDCRNCKFIHVIPIPSNQELNLFYNNEFHSFYHHQLPQNKTPWILLVGLYKLYIDLVSG